MNSTKRTETLTSMAKLYNLSLPTFKKNIEAIMPKLIEAGYNPKISRILFIRHIKIIEEHLDGG
jgi:hypothetical protein